MFRLLNIRCGQRVTLEAGSGFELITWANYLISFKCCYMLFSCTKYINLVYNGVAFFVCLCPFRNVVCPKLIFGFGLNLLLTDFEYICS